VALLWKWWARRPLINFSPACKSAQIPPFQLISTLAKTLVALGCSPRCSASIPGKQQLTSPTSCDCTHEERSPLIYVVFFPLLGRACWRIFWRTHILARWVLVSLYFRRDVPADITKPTADSPAHRASPRPLLRVEWLSSFLWIRTIHRRTSKFALDPEYLLNLESTSRLFRAVRRTHIRRGTRENTAGRLSFSRTRPNAGGRSAASDWVHVSASRFKILRERSGVTWVLLENSAPPFRVVVCP